MSDVPATIPVRLCIACGERWCTTTADDVCDGCRADLRRCCQADAPAPAARKCCPTFITAEEMAAWSKAAHDDTVITYSLTRQQLHAVVGTLAKTAAPAPAEAPPCEHQWDYQTHAGKGVMRCLRCREVHPYGPAIAQSAARPAPLPADAPQYDEYVIRNERRGTASDPRVAAAPARGALVDRLNRWRRTLGALSQRGTFRLECEQSAEIATLLREAARALAQRDEWGRRLAEAENNIETADKLLAQRDVPRAEPDGYFYEYETVFGLHRDFSGDYYNGSPPTRSVAYWTAPQERSQRDDDALALREDAELGRILMRYIDRLGDPDDECDPLPKIVHDLWIAASEAITRFRAERAAMQEERNG